MIPIEERTDTTLVTLARSGDKQAFGELIERYQLMAQMITLRLVGNLDVAREVMQEAMLQAYLSLDHLRDDTRFKGWFLNGSHPQNYEQGIEHSIKWNDESSVYLKNKVAEPAGFGAFMQIMRADAYQDKRVKLCGFVKAEAVEGYAGLCLCYDNQSMVATLNSIPSTLIAGTRDWQMFEIVADIPESSNSIGFGFMLSGNGQVWLGNIHFESVDRMVTAKS